VGQTFILLTATWLAGQNITPVAQPMSPAGNYQGTVMMDGGVGDMQPTFWDRVRNFHPFRNDDQPGFFQRLKTRMSGMLPGRGYQDNYAAGDAMPGSFTQSDFQRMPMAKMFEPPLSDGARQAPAKSSLSPTNFQTTMPAGKGINPKMVEKIGHENDYSWVTGQAFLENGKWVIRYATPEIVDRFGGSFILAPGTDTSKIRHGDLVTIQGQPVGSAGNGATLYRATSVNLIEHEN
jgi:hypothetical protein